MGGKLRHGILKSMEKRNMKQKKPVIGLTSSFMVHEDTEKVFLPHSYFDAIR